MKYIASWSGGKDSTATIILAHEKKEPLDLIIFSEVMFDENTSGETPEHIDFIKNKAKPLFESWGYEVRILRSEKNYMQIFNRIQTKVMDQKNKDRIGKIKGFPMAGKCTINRECKLPPIKKFLKELGEETIQYIGIAEDEPRRLARLDKNKISLLAKYHYTEEMAKELCKKYDLLSPAYEYTKRGGCWFCPNMREPEKKHLREYHREKWDKLIELEQIPNKIGDIFNILTGESIQETEKQFQIDDRQLTIYDFIEGEKND